LFNIVGNAIKFTKEGEITIIVRQQKLSETEAELHFAVADTGIGIPEDKQKTIFDLFSQADNSVTRIWRYGSGIIDFLTPGGNDGRQTLGRKRSRYRQHFPFHAALRTDQSAMHFTAANRRIPASRTLIVDDNAQCRQFLSQQISQWGSEVSARPMLRKR
jgi:predicted SnoaL-like aldol condensation-catalyzing enzyme